jgi:hypothetical protein
MSPSACGAARGIHALCKRCYMRLWRLCSHVHPRHNCTHPQTRLHSDNHKPPNIHHDIIYHPSPTAKLTQRDPSPSTHRTHARARAHTHTHTPPSATAKLMARDRILAVNGVNVSSVPLTEIPSLFEATILKIDVERPPDPAESVSHSVTPNPPSETIHVPRMRSFYGTRQPHWIHSTALFNHHFSFFTFLLVIIMKIIVGTGVCCSGANGGADRPDGQEQAGDVNRPER